ncbi:hypothetical protein HDU96_007894 [Phlyctochytrium bullatum]|nr:hypothetical protein HDU96_007894 [Phlyctochytrium bullatum]
MSNTQHNAPSTDNLKRNSTPASSLRQTSNNPTSNLFESMQTSSSPDHESHPATNPESSTMGAPMTLTNDVMSSRMGASLPTDIPLLRYHDGNGGVSLHPHHHQPKASPSASSVISGSWRRGPPSICMSSDDEDEAEADGRDTGTSMGNGTRVFGGVGGGSRAGSVAGSGANDSDVGDTLMWDMDVGGSTIGSGNASNIPASRSTTFPGPNTASSHLVPPSAASSPFLFGKIPTTPASLHHGSHLGISQSNSGTAAALSPTFTGSSSYFRHHSPRMRSARRSLSRSRPSPIQTAGGSAFPGLSGGSHFHVAGQGVPPLGLPRSALSTSRLSSTASSASMGSDGESSSGGRGRGSRLSNGGEVGTPMRSSTPAPPYTPINKIHGGDRDMGELTPGGDAMMTDCGTRPPGSAASSRRSSMLPQTRSISRIAKLLQEEVKPFEKEVAHEHATTSLLKRAIAPLSESVLADHPTSATTAASSEGGGASAGGGSGKDRPRSAAGPVGPRGSISLGVGSSLGVNVMGAPRSFSSNSPPDSPSSGNSMMTGNSGVTAGTTSGRGEDMAPHQRFFVKNEVLFENLQEAIARPPPIPINQIKDPANYISNTSRLNPENGIFNRNHEYITHSPSLSPVLRPGSMSPSLDRKGKRKMSFDDRFEPYKRNRLPSSPIHGGGSERTTSNLMSLMPPNSVSNSPTASAFPPLGSPALVLGGGGNGPFGLGIPMMGQMAAAAGGAVGGGGVGGAVPMAGLGAGGYFGITRARSLSASSSNSNTSSMAGVVVHGANAGGAGGGGAGSGAAAGGGMMGSTTFAFGNPQGGGNAAHHQFQRPGSPRLALLGANSQVSSSPVRQQGLVMGQMLNITGAQGGLSKMTLSE